MVVLAFKRSNTSSTLNQSIVTTMYLFKHLSVRIYVQDPTIHYYNMSTICSKKKHSATLPSCSLSLVKVPSISLASSWETSFVISCTVLVTALYWASIAGNFCLIFWKKCFKNISTTVFMCSWEIKEWWMIYILTVNYFCHWIIFQIHENEAKEYQSTHLNVIWN